MVNPDMYDTVISGKRALGLVILAAALVLGGPGTVRSETLKVGQPNQFLYPDPDFASPTLCPLPLGAEVTALLTAGFWRKVDYRGRKGWAPGQAFPQLKPVPGNLPGLLNGGGVKMKDHEEVALAGKAEKMPPPRIPCVGAMEKVHGDQTLYRDPDLGGSPVGKIPHRARVKMLALTGEWCKVDYQGMKGWLPFKGLSSR